MIAYIESFEVYFDKENVLISLQIFLYSIAIDGEDFPVTRRWQIRSLEFETVGAGDAATHVKCLDRRYAKRNAGEVEFG